MFLYHAVEELVISENNPRAAAPNFSFKKNKKRHDSMLDLFMFYQQTATFDLQKYKYLEILSVDFHALKNYCKNKIKHFININA